MRGTTVSPNQTVTFNINGVSTPVTSNDEGVFEITEGDKVLNSFSAANEAQLKTIDEFNYDTSKMDNMANMFYKCTNLVLIPKFDSSKVTTMYRMFYGCTNLTTIPVLDTSKVTVMEKMFYECTNLVTIPSLDTSQVTLMNHMFYECANLTSIPELNTSNAVDMTSMFYGCTKLTIVPLLELSKMESRTSTSYMFTGCANLTILGGFEGLWSNLDLSNSPLLTHESLMNVINYAAKYRSYLTLGSTNLAKLTDDEKAIATNKGLILE